MAPISHPFFLSRKQAAFVSLHARWHLSWRVRYGLSGSCSSFGSGSLSFTSEVKGLRGQPSAKHGSTGSGGALGSSGSLGQPSATHGSTGSGGALGSSGSLGQPSATQEGNKGTGGIGSFGFAGHPAPTQGRGFALIGPGKTRPLIPVSPGAIRSGAVVCPKQSKEKQAEKIATKGLSNEANIDIGLEHSWSFNLVFPLRVREFSLWRYAYDQPLA